MEYEAIRQKHLEHLVSRFPAMVDQLSWDAARLAARRESGLRALLAHAMERSPWHRERLRHVDPATVTEANLRSLPTMSKSDVAEYFDDIVCDRHLTREVVEDHLATLHAGDAYLLDRYHAVASGGSSGTRTVVVWDWDGWADCFLSLGRRGIVQQSRSGRPPVMASVSGDHASHLTAAIAQTFSSPLVTIHRVPASLPVTEIVRRLNHIQPVTLQGYPSMLRRLALEAFDGRLKIEPDVVLAGSETLTPETRVLLTEAWGVPVQNSYGASETGGIATDCGRGDGWLHLNDDVLIVEIESDRVLITNLMNKVMPLIRYELDDRVKLTDVACPCGTAHRTVAAIEGRTSEMFRLSGGVVVHPIVFSTAIGTNRGIADYQVRQNGDAITVDVVQHGDLDVSALIETVHRGLQSAGATGATVNVHVVDDIPRVGATAKARRFAPHAEGLS